MNERPEFSFLLYGLGRGGAEKVAISTINSLAKKYKVELVLLSDLQSHYVDENVSIVYLNRNTTNSFFKRLLFVLINAFNYSIYLKNRQPKVSISFLNRPNFINVLASLFHPNIKVVLNERSYPPEAYKKITISNLLLKIGMRYLYPFTDELVCNSQLTKEYFSRNQNLLGKVKVSTWQNPITIEDTTDKILDFKDTFKILSIGRLDKNKNHQMGVKGLSILNDNRVNFTIAGEGNMRLELERLINKLKLNKNVVLLGEQAFSIKKISGFEVLILCSYFEGFPNVILEAMLAGIPVISTDCKSGPREIFKVDANRSIELCCFTDYGVLVPVNNPLQLSRALKRLMNDLDYYQKVRDNGLKRVKDFSMDIKISEFEASFLS